MNLKKDIFPPFELELRKQIEDLMCRWEQIGEKNGYIITPDGSYLGYTIQSPKILFIGREPRYLKGLDYIKTLYHAFKMNKIGTESINQCSFHRRIFKIAYGLLINKLCKFEDIPHASEMCNDFGTEKLSFAFINISKISNESDIPKSNWNNIHNECKRFNISYSRRNRNS